MSRSEHGNARDKTNRRDVARKAAIKNRIVSERKHLDTAMPPVTSDAVSIVRIELGNDPCVVFPATADDLRGVMARLPEGSLNGLSLILLDVWDGDYLGHSKGVRGPETLGTYSPKDATICLYAYAVEPGVPNRAHVELYLRMRMLSTLMHEIGHHQDFMARETRGRWRGDGDEVEPNADARQRDWSLAHVVPYLEETYPDEVAALQRWLVSQLGVPVPLEYLVFPEDRLFGARDALEELLEADGIASLETRTSAAFHFHYEDHFELALAVLDHVLVEAPLDTNALTHRAHVLGHLGRHDEAIAIARDVLTRDPDNAKSHDLLRVASKRAGAWRDVIFHATRLIEGRWGHREALAARTHAWIELRDWVSAERDLGELRAMADSEGHDRVVRAFTCLWHARRGAIEEALELAREDGADTAAYVSDTLRELGDAPFADQLDALLAS